MTRADDPASTAAEPNVSSAQRRAGLAAVLVLIAGGLYTLRGFLPALIWAVIFAIALWPSFHRLAGRFPEHRRGLVPFAIVLAVLLLFVVPLVMVALPLLGDVHSATAWIETARRSGIAPPPLLATLPSGPRLIAWWRHNLGQPGQASVLASHLMHGSLIATGRAVAAQALHRLVLLLFTLVALFFLLREADEVARQVRVASFRAFGPKGEAIGLQMIRSVHGTVNGLVFVGLAEGVLMGCVYGFAGVSHPALFGLATAILAMIPFGAAVAIGLAGLTSFVLGSPAGALAIIIIGAVVTFVADHFIRPALIGGATRLPFLWVLLGILGGVEAWGLVGLFLGPAIMAALILLWREWVGVAGGPLDPPPADVRQADQQG